MLNNDLFELKKAEGMIMHVDMNSYFASCEQQANPAWRGKPLGVCSYFHPKGTIIAASKEAKLCGIKTGTKVGEALIKYPNIILVRDEPEKYRSVTKGLLKIFDSYSCLREKYSIDEVFLKFESSEKKNMIEIAKEIKRRIKDEIGEWLTCSVGIAGTKFFAKIASDFKKPDGLLCISVNNIDDILESISLTDIWGISHGLKIQLNKLGIFDPLALKKTKASFLLNKMGKAGFFLWARMNGLEIDQMKTEDKIKPKSIGHSYTIIKKTNDREKILSLFMKLSDKTGQRIRTKNLMGNVVCFGWQYCYGGGFFKQEKLKSNTNDSWEIFQVVQRKLKKMIMSDKIHKIYISLSGLKTQQVQLSIFEDAIKKIKLNAAVDKINIKYGEGTLSRGFLWNQTEEISDRIAFGN